MENKDFSSVRIYENLQCSNASIIYFNNTQNNNHIYSFPPRLKAPEESDCNFCDALLFAFSKETWNCFQRMLLASQNSFRFSTLKLRHFSPRFIPELFRAPTVRVEERKHPSMHKRFPCKIIFRKSMRVQHFFRQARRLYLHRPQLRDNKTDPNSCQLFTILIISQFLVERKMRKLILRSGRINILGRLKRQIKLEGLFCRRGLARFGSGLRAVVAGWIIVDDDDDDDEGGQLNSSSRISDLN